MTNEKKRIIFQFKLEESLLSELEEIAKAKGLSKSAYVRLVLIEKIKEEKSK